MGTNTLTTIGTSTPVLGTGDLVDQYKTALCVDFLPRNASGVPTTLAGSLGSSSIVWNSCFVDNIWIDGNTIVSTNANGDINITPNGSGSCVISKATIASGTASLSSATITTLTSTTISTSTLNANTIGSNAINGNMTVTPNGFGHVDVTKLISGDGLVDRAIKRGGLIEFFGKNYKKTFSIGAGISAGASAAPWDICYCPVNDNIYVCGTNCGVTPINCATGAVGTKITVGNFPQAIRYCPSNNHVYVCNATSNTVSYVNCETNTKTGDIGVGTDPESLCYCPTNNCMYVGNANGGNQGSVSVINCSTNAVVATITTDYDVESMVYCPTNDKVYAGNCAANGGSKSLSPITCSTNTKGTDIPMATQPYALCFCPYNNCIYIGSSSVVYVFDCVTETVIATISSVGAQYLTYSPSSNLIYATIGSTTVKTIDVTTNTVVETVTISGALRGSAFCPTNNLVYIPDYTGVNIYKVNTF